MKTVLLIGAGNMGFAMLNGWIRGLGTEYRFVVVDPMVGPAISEMEIGDSDPVTHYQHVSELPAALSPAAVILATKPDGLVDALKALAHQLEPETVVISVAAGKSIKHIREGTTADQPIVRVMPNIGALATQSVSAGFPSETTMAHRTLVDKLFRSIGDFTWLSCEDEMHAVTAVSGSGPAYFFAMCEAMIAATIETGVDINTARTLVLGTCRSAAALLETIPDATLLRERVTSPNGTTAAGLAALDKEDGLQRLISEAVDAARRRSIEMM